ncbi:flavodoxin family protein [Periweissella cryptocerci]|uniref:Flavodoxin family protein n=1 Tax=Periweissella cryptocerci TaxID=2506420 RepID=A0A4P6YSC0_9LACO|nr:NAD(P)H-dependent oxidoreductase [Periweissella cryptocerci]QBO35546.1 flavodoxin family protein [Periweissella cryptocerci]
MKNILVIFDHPYTADSYDDIPHNRSWSAKVYHELFLREESLGNHVDLIDLHADHFNPVVSKAELQNWRTRAESNPQIQDYQQRITQADEIFFIMPMWWELMPAMTKGFIDRVFTKRFLLGDASQNRNHSNRLTNLKAVHLISVQGTPKIIYTLLYKNALSNALLKGLFKKMGFKGRLKWHAVDGDAPDKKRQVALNKLIAKLK